MVPKRSIEEHDAASAVAALSNNPWKRPRVDSTESTDANPAKVQKDSVGKVTDSNARELKPAPFFYYRDFSTETDPDPLTPLTPPGRVPNFPAKMHAILSRSDLSDIVAWMPHGRAWRVLKPREFELRVIPTYFEHSKFSSFIRQANGWGFRRITQGKDRNSYYHELFLRGLPHLCKKMKRPGVAQKAAADAEHEPDLYNISEIHPVPEKASDDSIMLRCTVQGGPKARMPIYSGARLSDESIRLIHKQNSEIAGQGAQQRFVAFSHAAQGKQGLLSNPRNGTAPNAGFYMQPQALLAPVPLPGQLHQGDARLSCLAPADNLAMALQKQSTSPSSLQASTAASQFAAGFAAATALNTNHLRSVLGQALVAPFPQVRADGGHAPIIAARPSQS